MLYFFCICLYVRKHHGICRKFLPAKDQINPDSEHKVVLVLVVQMPEMYLILPYQTYLLTPPSLFNKEIIPQKEGEKLRKCRNVLDKKRKDAKELIGMIENLPEDKKREVLGIVQGYSLCVEAEKKEVEVK